MNKSILLLLILCTTTFQSWAQRGKNGNVIVNSVQTVNQYYRVTNDIDPGATNITLENTAGLSSGDYVLIIQMAGAEFALNYNWWNAQYSSGEVTTVPANENLLHGYLYGILGQYKDVGKHEFAEVRVVGNATTITLNCGVQNTYKANKKIQVVKVPRYNRLTINAGGQITATPWNGQTGGIVAVEVDSTFSVNTGTNSAINANGLGYRGGLAIRNNGIDSHNPPHTNQIGAGDGFIASLHISASYQGESIFGDTNDYKQLGFVCHRGRSGVMNGGGGGGIESGGGGGGSNVAQAGTFVYRGRGVLPYTPATAPANMVTAWNRERNPIVDFWPANAAGGGRGGHSAAAAKDRTYPWDADPSAFFNNTSPVTYGPNSTAWNGAKRKENGGYGGEPLPYERGRVFFGGGGGAANQDSDQGGSGGNGGGIVFVLAYGEITGTGVISARGADGQSSNPTNRTNFPSSNKLGNDGAGGGGGGGSIVIKNMSPIPATLTLDVKGGNGGDYKFRKSGTSPLDELAGPGGAGQGGLISLATGTAASTNIQGGNAGIATRQISNATPTVYFANVMPTNGATNGSAGYIAPVDPIYNVRVSPVTICAGQTASLRAEIVGQNPGGVSFNWYETVSSTVSLSNQATYTTPVLTATKTYYVRVCPGNYRIPVTVTVVPNVIISGTPTITQPSCVGGGSITGLNVSGGANLTYSWSNGANTLNLTNVAAGSYTLTVTSPGGCATQAGPYELVGISGPTLTTAPTITPQNCNGLGGVNGMVVNAPSGVQSITLNGNAVTSLNQSLSAGSYTFVVTDNNGCISTFGPYTISNIPGPSISGTPTVVDATCNSGGSISGFTFIPPTGLNFSWSNSTQTTSTLSNAPVGTYVLTATDANGCSIQSNTIAIGNQSEPQIIGTPTIVQPTCLQGGAITGLSVNGGVGTLTYAWTGGGTGIDLTSIPAGDYTLVVTDANGCSASSNTYSLVNPDAPIIGGTAIITPISCNGNGSITGLSVSGGVAPYIYTYNLSPSAGLNYATATPGSYTLRVADANGCVVTSGPYDVNQVNLPQINGLSVLTHQSCNTLGSASVTAVTEGVAPYTLTWSDGETIGNNASLAAGNYTVTVTDALGCSTISNEIVIDRLTDPSIITTNAVVTPVLCTGTGRIAGVTVSGGTAPFVYAWNGVNSTSLDLDVTAAGGYVLTVTDVNGCSAQSDALEVGNVNSPILGDGTAVEITCNRPGMITDVSITGGTAPYTVSWEGTTVTAPYNLTSTLAGVYTLRVVDASGCIVTRDYTITEIPEMTLTGTVAVRNATCDVLGQISGWVIAGGQGPYTYSFNNGVNVVQTNSTTLNNAIPGFYTLTVRDENSCEVISEVVQITGPDFPRYAINPTVNQPTCLDGGGVVGYQVTGGQAPYTYLWTTTNNTSQYLTDVDPGVYSLRVTDNQGCTLEDSFVLIAPQIPIISPAVAITAQTCLTGGSITGVSVANGTQPYTYLWSNGATTIDVINLVGGTYSVVVTDANGCEASASFGVAAPDLPDLAISYLPAPAIINTPIVFTAESSVLLGGHSWSIGEVNYNTGLDQIDSVFTAGGYVTVVVTAVSADGCVLRDSIEVVVFADLQIPNVITANGDGVNDFFDLGPVLPNTYVLILDRWGNIVFETENYKNEWNGKDKHGKPVMDGVYTYMVQTEKGDKFHGFVTIVDSKK